ncbi:MAG: DUF1043 family protein [Candidatus Endonucleobacter sp. (ex Gigantidas childressi)]|nr:DUF1043 family protein [Candidatus Endonucleobacter sp. (ex Gigantidas childressi)]
MIWLIGCLAFFTGGACGLLIYHVFSGGNALNSKLADQLDGVRRDYTEYQDKVNDHFTTTAHLINKMTDTYKNIHEHMAEGAESLCHNEQVEACLTDALLSSNTLLSEQDRPIKRRNSTDSPLEQPKDYALKTKPKETGMLSEEFGLKKDLENNES